MGAHVQVRERNALVLADALAGASRSDLATKYGLSYPLVCQILRGVGVPDGRCGSQADAERNAKMVSMFKQGVTLQKIGDQYGLTRERVRQILQKQGIVGKDGGQQAAVRKRQVSKEAIRDAKCMLRWGVPFAVFEQLRKDRVIAGYKMHVRNSADRGIPFKLSFPEWLAIWQASGKLELRGRGKGKYVMSRIKDDGCYEVGNVHIQSAVENSREAVKKWVGNAPKEFPGTFLLYPGSKRPWFAKVGRKSLGRFSSQEEAIQAREAWLNVHPESRIRRGRGYTYIPGKNGRKDRYQVMVSSKYVGTYATAELALAARAEFLAAQEA